MGARAILTAFRVMPAVLIAAMGVSTGAASQVIIGANAEAPVHYHVARALCRAISASDEKTVCKAERIESGDAAGPIAVLSDVRNGTIDFGIAPSDWTHHAFAGTGPAEFMDVQFENLRTLLVLHSEPFTVVARRDARISTLDDLAGKRVNIGRAGSKHRLVMEQVMSAKGWSRESFQLADELTGPEQSLALCHNRIQAMVATVAHPDNGLAKTIELCGAEIVEIAGPAIDGLISKQPYFSPSEVPGNLYAGQDKPVKTFGIRVLAVTTEDVAEDDAYAAVRSVIENLDNFKRLHPALKQLQPRDMVYDGAVAPIHPGAAKYFREKGMM